MSKVIVTELRTKWERQQKTLLKKHGFDVDQLSCDQIELLLQPSKAPDAYYMDGEIDEKTAFEIWMKSLHASGMSEENIKRAIELNEVVVTE